MSLKDRIRKLEAWRKPEPVVVLIITGTEEPPPGWVEEQKARALQEDPGASYIFLEWPPEPPRQEWGEEE